MTEESKFKINADKTVYLLKYLMVFIIGFLAGLFFEFITIWMVLAEYTI